MLVHFVRGFLTSQFGFRKPQINVNTDYITGTLA